MCVSQISWQTVLLYSLFTHDCMAMYASNSIIKFADDTTVVGLSTNNDKTAYWPTAPNVTGMPKRSSRTITMRATACSTRYHPEGKVSIGASKLGPKDRSYFSISRSSDWKTATTNRGCCLHTDLKSLATLINGSLVTLIMPLNNDVYISCITHPICIYCILYHLAYAARSLLIRIFICTYSYSIEKFKHFSTLEFLF